MKFLLLVLVGVGLVVGGGLWDSGSSGGGLDRAVLPVGGEVEPGGSHGGEELASERVVVRAMDTAGVAGKDGGASEVGLEQNAEALVCEVRIELVEWHSKLPVQEGVVEILSGSDRGVVQEVRVGDGGFALATLPIGDFVFAVREDSLVEGWIPPPFQRRNSRSYAEGLHAPKLQVEAGMGAQTVTIPIHRAARIIGYVRDANGDPMPDSFVQVSSILKGRHGSQHRLNVDETGFFEEYVKEGNYRLRVFAAEKLAGIPNPVPVDVALVPGQENLTEFVYAPGPCSIVGQVGDVSIMEGEKEIVWADLPILILPCKEDNNLDSEVHGYLLNDVVAAIRTDADGKYSAKGLMPGRYKLAFDPHGGHVPSKKDCRFGGWSKRFEFTLESKGIKDLGTQNVSRARPCDVDGRVILPRSNRAGQWEVCLWYPVRFGDDRRPYRKAVKLRGDGTFDSFVHTSPDYTPAKIGVRKRGETEWLATREFTVTPNGRASVHLDLETR